MAEVVMVVQLASSFVVISNLGQGMRNQMTMLAICHSCILSTLHRMTTWKHALKRGIIAAAIMQESIAAVTSASNHLVSD